MMNFLLAFLVLCSSAMGQGLLTIDEAQITSDGSGNIAVGGNFLYSEATTEAIVIGGSATSITRAPRRCCTTCFTRRRGTTPTAPPKR